MQQQQQTTTPASAGVDFDDAKKTPRRLGLVFGVGYYRSGERHGERFEIDRGIEETRGSREHVRPGDHHGLDGIWFVPDHGRLHGGVRVRRAGWAVGEFGWTVVVFNGRSSRERLRRCRRDARDWRGYSGVFALVDLSRRRGVVVAIHHRRSGIGVGDQRVRVSLRAYGDYVEQLRRGYVESSVLAYGCGQENRIGRTRFGHGDVAVVAESDGVCQF